MQKKLLLIATLQSLYMFAPPRSFKPPMKQQESTENQLTTVNTNNKGSVSSMPTDTEKASTSFLRDSENDSNKISVIVRHAHEEDEDAFVVENDEYDTTALEAKTPQTWVVLFYEKCHRTIQEKCLFQKYCQRIGLMKKYTVLNKLREKGQLTNYINELNNESVMTGDSFLNEALCEAIVDEERDILINLLSETLEYRNGLSNLTKQQISKFLQDDNLDKQQDISIKIGQYLERVRLTTQIRHALNEEKYSGPNLVNITATVAAHVKTLTDGVVNNTLIVEKSEEKQEAK